MAAKDWLPKSDGGTAAVETGGQDQRTDSERPRLRHARHSHWAFRPYGAGEAWPLNMIPKDDPIRCPVCREIHLMSKCPLGGPGPTPREERVKFAVRRLTRECSLLIGMMGGDEVAEAVRMIDRQSHKE